MSQEHLIVIGTRGSKLSLAQTQLVADALEQQNPGTKIQVQVIATKGDVNQAPIPLDTVGKDWFTGEIEDALLQGKIDIAIHSLKDLSPEARTGLTTLTVLERADPRDVLISKSGLALKDLPPGAIIGTDSIRRKMLLLELRPDVAVQSIRGNIDTRIAKLRTEQYDAIVLAAAGLARVGMVGAITEFFDAGSFIPAGGQGILAAQARGDRTDLITMLAKLTHRETAVAAEAEQVFLRTIGGGCKLPVGCYAKVENEKIFLSGILGTGGDAKAMRDSATGPVNEANTLAKDLASKILKRSKS